MTVEVFEPASLYEIAGIGPYAIPHPYERGAIQAHVVTDRVIPLTDADFTLTPEAGAIGGDLYLSPAAAALYGGARLMIDRRTPDEQGWKGLLGERERGLEWQLDKHTMAIQEVRRHTQMTLRSVTPLAPMVPVPGRVLMFDGEGIVGGPLAADIANAQVWAEMTIAAATFNVESLAGLLGSTTGFPMGAIITTRAEGYSYRVVGSDPHLATAGGVMLQALLRNGVVYPMQLAAVGDGVVNDTVAFRLAWMLAWAKNAILDGGGRTYRITQTQMLPPSRLRWRNMTIDGQDIPTNGLYTTPIVEMVCAEPAVIGNVTVNVADNMSEATLDTTAGLVADDWVLLTSQKKMAETEVEGETTRHSRACELLRVKAVSGNTVIFWSRTRDRYNVADIATVQKVQTAAGVDFENVAFIGADTGFRILDGFESRYRKCRFINQTTRGCDEDRCYRTDGDDWTFRSEATEPGFTQAPYGLCYTACQNCHYGDITGDRTRHLTTTGSNRSSRGRHVSRGCTLGDIYSTNSFSSVVDQHPGGGFIQVGNVYAEFAENASHFVACQFQGAGGTVKAINANNGAPILFDTYGFAQVRYTPMVIVGSIRCGSSEYAVSVSNYTNRYGTGTPQKIVLNIGLINVLSGTAFLLNPANGNIEIVISGGQINTLVNYGSGKGFSGGSPSFVTRLRLANVDLQTPANVMAFDLNRTEVSMVGGSMRGEGGNAIIKLNGGEMRIVGTLEAGITTELSGGATIQRATMN
ncbi:hypothetical protein [Paracoccus sp. SSK6]|uniref:hypothetical protein n=1 Tax=Paracoccus sp. SSK6 TaxID=3143131 RepID=UPI00321C14E2